MITVRNAPPFGPRPAREEDQQQTASRTGARVSIGPMPGGNTTEGPITALPALASFQELMR
jgi:hypothetical protein